MNGLRMCAQKLRLHRRVMAATGVSLSLRLQEFNQSNLSPKARGGGLSITEQKLQPSPQLLARR